MKVLVVGNGGARMPDFVDSREFMRQVEPR